MTINRVFFDGLGMGGEATLLFHEVRTKTISSRKIRMPPGNIRTKLTIKASQYVCWKGKYVPNPQKRQISTYFAANYTYQITKNSKLVRTSRKLQGLSNIDSIHVLNSVQCADFLYHRSCVINRLADGQQAVTGLYRVVTRGAA